MQTVKVLISGETNFMQTALAQTTSDAVKSYMYETAASADDEEITEYVLEGARESITDVLNAIEAIARDSEAEDLFGGKLWEI